MAKPAGESGGGLAEAVEPRRGPGEGRAAGCPSAGCWCGVGQAGPEGGKPSGQCSEAGGRLWPGGVWTAPGVGMLPLRLRKSPPSLPGLDLQLRSAAGDGQDGGAPRQTDAPADSSASRRGPGRGRAARGPCCLKAQRSRALRSSAPRAPLLREEDRPANGKPPAARRLCPWGDTRPPRKARPLPTAWWEVSVPTWTHKMGRRRGVGGHRKRGERASPRPLCVPGGLSLGQRRPLLSHPSDPATSSG